MPDGQQDPTLAPATALEGPAERRVRAVRRGAIDPDVDLGEPDQPNAWTAHHRVLPAIAVGGAVGASARRALELLLPVHAGTFPWATFLTNLSGCALIGLLMVVAVDRGAGHPLLRPFLGVGVLGGYTTFSTYAVQTSALADTSPILALGYLFGTVVAALLAVAFTVRLARAALLPQAFGSVPPTATTGDE